MEDLRSILPTGYYFSPTDTELLEDYLKKKVLGDQFPDSPDSVILPDRVIPTANDLFVISPDRLTSSDHLKRKLSKEWEWYFFTTGRNSTKDDLVTTTDGYYVHTCEEEIRNNDKLVGFMTTFAFFQGQQPHGTKTEWFLHQYRLNQSNPEFVQLDISPREKVSNIVVCKIVNTQLYREE